VRSPAAVLVGETDDAPPMGPGDAVTVRPAIARRDTCTLLIYYDTDPLERMHVLYDRCPSLELQIFPRVSDFS
jgi:hypothetical protein